MLLGGGIAPLLTLNLQHELQLSGKLQAVVFFTPGDSTKQPMTGKLGGFQTQSGHKRRKFFDSAKSNTDSPVIHPATYSLHSLSYPFFQCKRLHIII
jgi:hypothetical protein